MKRSKFSLSHYKLFSCDMGELIPCGMYEVLPGDSFQQQSHCLIRVSPLVAPMMHPVHVNIHHWFVPYRLLWTAWEDFITGGPDGMDASVFPTRVTTPGEGTLMDYLGITPGVNQTVSALPIRAYQLIWNEFYRDQDLQAEAVVSTASGADGTTSTTLQFRAWEKDYFTTSRPWPQKGAAVTIPLGTTAPVSFQEVGATPGLRNVFRNAAGGGAALGVTEAGTANANIVGLADLTGASAATIDQLRRAFALQNYAEARAKYGSRYTEYLRYLGIKSSDARLQRPEYLGGGRQMLQISEILQTAPTTSGSQLGVGALKGHGIGAMRSNRYRRFFEEHGVVLSLMSVLPKTMYVQGQHRSWARRTREDFFQRELQHIGQQTVLNKEIYAAHASPDATFGYQDRYDEYRRMESSIGGEFRSTLDYWHMARIFSSSPALNGTFVQSNPTKRVNAVTTNDVLWCMVNHSIQARRMVAKKGNNRIT